jgi:UDP-N-acetylmuramoyl-tripeptide--D-alanyl-D-alanine ligase
VRINELYQLYLQHPVILTDTRKIEAGGIFFALRGNNFNGNAFAADALKAGAAFAVIDDAQYADTDGTILVPNVLETLQQLARHHRQQLHIPVIAITGSNGKTTTKELVTTVLRKHYTTYATIGNLNNHIGVPLTLLKIKPNAEIAIIEMGANHQKEIASYCVIAMPTHGIITNCGKAHIEGFGGEEGVRKGKGELYDYLRLHNGAIFRNADLDYLNNMAHGITAQITYGSSNATYSGKPTMNGVFLSVSFADNNVVTVVDTQLVGAYNFPNVMTAIAVGLHFGLQPADIKAAIEAYSPDNSRSQWVQKGSNKIILDAYNANPSSMQAAIQNFATSPLQNKMLWIGGMKEMGEAEMSEHMALVTLIAGYEWTDVILVGNEFKAVEHRFRWFADSTQAAAYVATHQPQNAAILIKGSRGSKMEVMANVIDI